MSISSEFSSYINEGYTSKGQSITLGGAILNEEIKSEEKQSSEPSTASVIGKSVVKVVTSATFIRGVFGVLCKLFRK